MAFHREQLPAVTEQTGLMREESLEPESEGCNSENTKQIHFKQLSQVILHFTSVYQCKPFIYLKTPFAAASSEFIWFSQLENKSFILFLVI